MREPRYRMITNSAGLLPNMRPVDVLVETQKNPWRALIRSLGQHDFVTFVKWSGHFRGSHIFRFPQARDTANGITLAATTARCQSPEKLISGMSGL